MEGERLADWDRPQGQWANESGELQARREKLRFDGDVMQV